MRCLVCATRATIRSVPASNRRGVAWSPGLVVDGPDCPDGADGSVSIRIALSPPCRPASGAGCPGPSPPGADLRRRSLRGAAPAGAEEESSGTRPPLSALIAGDLTRGVGSRQANVDDLGAGGTRRMPPGRRPAAAAQPG